MANSKNAVRLFGTRTTGSTYGLSPAGDSGNKPPTDDVVIALQHNVDCFCVGDMFLFEDSFRESVFVVRSKNRNRFLDDDRAMIELFVNEMNCAAGHFDAVSERLLLRFQTRK